MFTDDEIEDDVERQKEANKVKQLFKTNEVLKPMFRHHSSGKTSIKGENAGNVLQKTIAEDNTQFYLNLYLYFQRRAQSLRNINWDFVHEITSRGGFCGTLCCLGGGS